MKRAGLHLEIIGLHPIDIKVEPSGTEFVNLEWIRSKVVLDFVSKGN